VFAPSPALGALAIWSEANPPRLASGAVTVSQADLRAQYFSKNLRRGNPRRAGCHLESKGDAL
jgi:hypothetical protein